MTTERIGQPSLDFFVFVGENRSPKAKDNGYSWTGCQITGIPRLAMKPLWEALELVGLNPRYPLFLNLWNDDMSPNKIARDIIKEMSEDGEIIIGMGRHVQAELRMLEIPHREMVHPATRNKLRRTDLYRAHVREVLCR